MALQQTPPLASSLKSRYVRRLTQPKCGFLFDGPTVYPPKRVHSRYRIQRIYKAAVASAQYAPDSYRRPAISRSEFDTYYDPLDFYHEDPDRQRRAIRALCADWALARSNNLDVWYDGQKIFLKTVGFYF